jgi:menaquinone-dependent protoporphyrinogen oxidase
MDPAIKVLVVTASDHGSTAEIGDWISAVLREVGHEVEHADAAEAPDPSWFDAVVLGSAVYAGRWMKTARTYVADSRNELAGRPVWLFSSGPIGDPPKPEEDPVDVASLVADTGAREHRVFGGRLIRHELPFGQRAIVAALHAPDGDFRDRAEIDAWARSIATALVPLG